MRRKRIERERAQRRYQKEAHQTSGASSQEREKSSGEAKHPKAAHDCDSGDDNVILLKERKLTLGERLESDRRRFEREKTARDRNAHVDGCCVFNRSESGTNEIEID